MMDPINIILIAIIAYTLYMLTYKKEVKGESYNNQGKIYTDRHPHGKSFHNNRYHHRRIADYYKHDNNSYADDILDDIVSWDDSYDCGAVQKETLNQNFINIQFHNDYRDVMTALNNVVPQKKQRFNLANIPLKYTEPEVKEVKNLVTDFVAVLNKNIIEEVPTSRNPNSGWDEAIVDPTVKSGWDKTQEALGLPTSLYEDPAPKSQVKLIAVNQVQKYETDDEIKYSIDMVIQKLNVEDQMIIKASFVQDKRPMNDENNFFKTTIIEMNISIEDIYILGYLSRYGDDTTKEFDGDEKKYYDYNKMEYNNMVDPKYIQKILMEKYSQRTEEMEQRNAMLDEEGQQFHKDLPHIYDFSNVRGTQTIFDDMNKHREFI